MKIKMLGSVVLSTFLCLGMTGCNDDDNNNIVTSSSSSVSSQSSSQAVSSVPSETDTIAAALEAQSNAAIAAATDNVDANDRVPFGSGYFSPFERVAVIPVIKDGNGQIDHNATYAKVKSLAKIFAEYVATTNEPEIDGETFKGSNWIVAGIEETPTEELYHHNLLEIPTPEPINPAEPASKANSKKVHLVEICNNGYAKQALGVSKVGGDDGAYVPNGIYHATALPCEVAFYNDDQAIYVDMLNPETIFTLFFTDVFGAPEMGNPAFQNAMMSLPSQVKGEIYALIYNALDNSDAPGDYTKSSIKMGTIFASMSMAMGIPQQAVPFAHYRYKGTGKAFTADDIKAMAHTIIEVFTIHGTENAGQQEDDLLNILPSVQAGLEPTWKSARHEPLKVPGGSWIIEGCSPYYAKQAMGTRLHHATALPCEIALFVDPEDNTSINVSYLNPAFMFGALFEDAMRMMSVEQQQGFSGIIENINADLRTMVDYAFEHNISEIDHASKEEIFPIGY